MREYAFLPKELPVERVQSFFLGCLNSKGVQLLIKDDIYEPGGFGYQLMYFGWLVHTGQLRVLMNPKKGAARVFSEEPTGLDVDVLLNSTDFPDLYSMGMKMQIGWNARLLYKDICRQEGDIYWYFFPGETYSFNDVAYFLNTADGVLILRVKEGRKFITLFKDDCIEYMLRGDEVVEYIMKHEYTEKRPYFEPYDLYEVDMVRKLFGMVGEN